MAENNRSIAYLHRKSKKLKSTEKVLRTYKKVKHPLMKRSRVSILSSVASAAEIILTGTNYFIET